MSFSTSCWSQLRGPVLRNSRTLTHAQNTIRSFGSFAQTTRRGDYESTLDEDVFGAGSAESFGRSTSSSGGATSSAGAESFYSCNHGEAVYNDEDGDIFNDRRLPRSGGPVDENGESLIVQRRLPWKVKKMLREAEQGGGGEEEEYFQGAFITKLLRFLEKEKCYREYSAVFLAEDEQYFTKAERNNYWNKRMIEVLENKERWTATDCIHIMNGISLVLCEPGVIEFQQGVVASAAGAQSGARRQREKGSNELCRDGTLRKQSIAASYFGKTTPSSLDGMNTASKVGTPNESFGERKSSGRGRRRRRGADALPDGGETVDGVIDLKLTNMVLTEVLSYFSAANQLGIFSMDALLLAESLPTLEALSTSPKVDTNPLLQTALAETESRLYQAIGAALEKSERANDAEIQLKTTKKYKMMQRKFGKAEKTRFTNSILTFPDLRWIYMQIARTKVAKSAKNGMFVTKAKTDGGRNSFGTNGQNPDSQDPVRQICSIYDSIEERQTGTQSFETRSADMLLGEVSQMIMFNINKLHLNDPRASLLIAHTWVLANFTKEKNEWQKLVKESGLMYLSAVGIQRVLTNRLPVTTVEALAAFEAFSVCREHFPKLHKRLREFALSSIEEGFGANLRGEADEESAPQKTLESYPKQQDEETKTQRALNEQQYKRCIVRKCHASSIGIVYPQIWKTIDEGFGRL